MIFPEGTRSTTGDLLPFKDGAFRLAIESGVPILPLAVHGTATALRPHSWKYGRSTAEVRVLEPVPTEGLTLDDMAKLKQQVRERIVPLGLAITRFGEALPSGDSTFTITAFNLGTGTIPHDTIQDDFAKSLYFLDGKLASGILDAYRKDDIIRKFLTNSSSSEIDIDVKKVSLEELQTPPYRARVDFYMVYYSAADHSELKRDLYTANFVFVFKSQVPNELIPINPLGMTITYFREDEASK